jgi:signal peptidase I
VVSQTRRIIFGRHPRRTVVRILVLAAVSFVTFGWLLTPTRVRGVSMQPTYHDSTLHLVNRIIYKVRSPARGDVVAIRLAGPHVLYVKRIIGLPAERVAIVDGVVQIDGVPLAEPYVVERAPWNYAEVTVGPAEYFVIGDNRGMRIGDHDFGRVDARRIIGRLLF